MTALPADAHLSEADPSQAATQEVVQAGARAVGGVAPVEAVLHHVLRGVAPAGMSRHIRLMWQRSNCALR